MNGFHSRSTMVVRKKKAKKQVEVFSDRIIEKVVEKKNCVFFFGERDEAFSFGKALCIDIYEGEKLYSDTSFIVDSGAVFVNNVVPGIRLFHAVSVAVNYGVPVVWRHKQIAPLKWMWGFTKCYVGKEALDVGRVWNDVLNLMR